MQELPEPATTDNPLSEALTSERTDLVVGAISLLPPAFALGVTLVDLQGLSYAEVSAISDVNVGTVRSRLARGRSRRRELLGGV